MYQTIHRWFCSSALTTERLACTSFIADSAQCWSTVSISFCIFSHAAGSCCNTMPAWWHESAVQSANSTARQSRLAPINDGLSQRCRHPPQVTQEANGTWRHGRQIVQRIDSVAGAEQRKLPDAESLVKSRTNRRTQRTQQIVCCRSTTWLSDDRQTETESY